MDFLNYSLAIIEQFHYLGYWIILIVSFLESLVFIGIIIPGTVIVVLFGFATAGGVWDLGDMILFAAIGSILGDTFSYYLGTCVKKSSDKDSKSWKSKYLNKGKVFFKNYGGVSIFLGRFIGYLRPFIPFVAGIFRMNKKKFLLWNVFSGVAWAISYLLIGFFFGQAWEAIVLWSKRGSLVIALFFGFIIAIYLLEKLITKSGRKVFFLVISVIRSIKQAIINNPDVQKITKKHKKLFGFIGRRLNKNHFFGLPTTLLVFSFVYIIFLFVGVVEDVINTDIIISIDTRIANLFATLRNLEMINFFLWVTLLGKWQIVSGFIMSTIFGLWIWGKRLYIIPLLVTIIGSEVFTALGKIAFHRPRPELAVCLEHSFSFPSGHATIAVSFYGFLTYFLIRNVKKWKTKVKIFFAGLVVITIIGFSRLYLGVHYVSDVWAGYLIGSLWLIIGISISEWLCLTMKKKKNLNFSLAKIKIISVVLISISILFYVIFANNYHPRMLSPLVNQEKITIKNVNDVFSKEQLKYTETLTGRRQEPISFVIFAKSDKKFIKIFTDAGWFIADKADIFSITRTAKAVLLKQSYPQAPMTPVFWNKQTHNFGFEKPTNSNNVRERHHARFWKTNYITEEDYIIYIGTTSLDIGMKWGITHKINPDIDTEREFLFNDIKNTDGVMFFKKEKFVNPILGQNFFGDLFFTDGQIYIINQ